MQQNTTAKAGTNRDPLSEEAFKLLCVLKVGERDTLRALVQRDPELFSVRLQLGRYQMPLFLPIGRTNIKSKTKEIQISFQELYAKTEPRTHAQT